MSFQSGPISYQRFTVIGPNQPDHPSVELIQQLQNNAMTIVLTGAPEPLEYGWNGATLSFERVGVHGTIALEPGKVHVKAHLSFLLLAIRGAVEQSVNDYLDKEFG